MKNKATILLLLLIFLFLFTSCATPSHKDNLIICFSYSVPGMLYSDLKGRQSIEYSETDSYGRELYKYTEDNSITEKEETVIVICQKCDEKKGFVYFYEDLNYLVGSCDEQDIALLKEQNDWERPLDESKMSRRYADITFDRFISNTGDLLEGNKANKAIEQLFGEKEEMYTWTIDTDSTGQMMFVVSCKEKEEAKKYFALVDLSYNVTITEIQFVDGFIDKDAYSTFKQENGWTYGW